MVWQMMVATNEPAIRTTGYQWTRFVARPFGSRRRSRSRTMFVAHLQQVALRR